MSNSRKQIRAWQRLRVLLSAPGRKITNEQPCFTDLVTATGVRVRIPAAWFGRGAFGRKATTTSLQQRFAKRIGRELTMQLRAGLTPVWSGPVRLSGLEMPSEGEDLVPVTLVFERVLTDDDLLRLGLREPTLAPAPEEPEPVLPDLPIQPSRGEPSDAPAEPMPEGGRRVAERVATDVPLAVHTAKGRKPAHVQDISRTGLRLHVRAKDLGFAPTRDLQEVAIGVGDMLRQTFPVDLNHEMLGSLLRKQVEMIRLSVARESAAFVEICGRFDEPLSLEETTMLGIPLPPPRDSEEEWDPEQEMVAPAARTPTLPQPPVRRRKQPPTPVPEATPEPVEEAPDPATPEAIHAPDADDVLGYMTKRRYRAFLRTGGASRGTPVICQTDLVGYEGVRLRLPRSAAPSEEAGVTQRLAAFHETFGGEPNTKIMDGAEHIWTGPTRLAALDLPPDHPEEMWVTLAFVHPLRPAEIRRMGLPAA